MFSDAFLEGQTRDINGEFPSDSHPYTEHYDYQSDSDLEDESYRSDEEYEGPTEGNPELPWIPQDPDSQAPPTATSEHPPPPPPDSNEAHNGNRLALISIEPSDISC